MKFGRASQCPEVISNEVSNPKNNWCSYGHDFEGGREIGFVSTQNLLFECQYLPKKQEKYLPLKVRIENFFSAENLPKKLANLV